MQIIKRHRWLLLPLILLVAIWIFSAMPGAISNSQSLPFAHSLHLPHALVRKLAHIFIYAILGVTWFIYYRSIIKRHDLLLVIILSLLSCFLSAALDEFHQSFVPHRSGLITDVLIDTLAASIGILLALFVAKLHAKTKSTQQKPKPHSK